MFSVVKSIVNNRLLLMVLQSNYLLVANCYASKCCSLDVDSVSKSWQHFILITQHGCVTISIFHKYISIHFPFVPFCVCVCARTESKSKQSTGKTWLFKSAKRCVEADVVQVSVSKFSVQTWTVALKISGGGGG
jgi:hypothetical protein